MTAATSPSSGRGGQLAAACSPWPGAESLAIGLLAGLLGAGLALGAVSLLLGGAGVGLTAGRAGVTFGACCALAVVGALAARVGATWSVWRTSISESAPRRPPYAAPALAAAVPRSFRLDAQRADLLAHRQHRLLRGRQPGLEPDPLALGLHVLRAGAVMDWCHTAARPPARPSAHLGSGACRQPASRRRRRRLPALQCRTTRRRDQPRPAGRPACSSPSGSTLASSPPPTTSKPTSTLSSRWAPT